MAVQFDIEHKRGSVYHFYPQDIVIKPELNGRHDLPDISALKDDIEERGQLQPVLVRSDGGKPVLVAGFSRWRAVTEINKGRAPSDRIRLACSYIRMNERDAYIANWKENRVRNATTPLDDAHQFAQMERWGFTVDDIAAKCGVKAAFVRRRLKLADMDPAAKAAIQDGRLKPSAAATIAKLSAEQQREVVSRNGKVTAETIASVTGARCKKRPTQALADLRALVEEAADIHAVKAVQDFARKLLEAMA